MINSMVKVELYLPVFSTTKIVTCKCLVDDSTSGRYNMIIGRDILTKLGIYLNIYGPVGSNHGSLQNTLLLALGHRALRDLPRCTVQGLGARRANEEGEKPRIRW